MIEKHFEIGLTKIDGKLEEPFVKYNQDLEPVEMTWDELADYLNEILEAEGNEPAYRNGESLRCMVKEERKSRGMLKTNADKLFTEKQEIYKERLRLHAERNDIKAALKKVASRETFEELLLDVTGRLTKKMDLSTPKTVLVNGKRSGILLIGDWHYGLNVNNYVNVFNHEVFVERIKKLTTEAVIEIRKHQLEKLYVANLNDLISGIIHQSLRLQNSEDIIEQIMFVTDTLIQMIQEFSKYTLVEYHDCIDNHSRVVADRKLALNKENFAMLTPWIMHKAFEKNGRVEIVENEFDEDIITMKIYGWNYLGVHGHLDNMVSAVNDLSLMTRRFYNVVFLGHNHHFAADEVHKTYVYMNGSLSGVDQFAKDARMTSNPSQTLIIVSPDDFAEYFRVIKL